MRRINLPNAAQLTQQRRICHGWLPSEGEWGESRDLIERYAQNRPQVTSEKLKWMSWQRWRGRSRRVVDDLTIHMRDDAIELEAARVERRRRWCRDGGGVNDMIRSEGLHEAR
jgi:hypothetical protein